MSALMAQTNWSENNPKSWQLRVLLSVFSCISWQQEVINCQTKILLGITLHDGTSLAIQQVWIRLQGWLDDSVAEFTSWEKEMRSCYTMVATTLHFYQLTTLVPLRLLQNIITSRDLLEKQHEDSLVEYFDGKRGREAAWHAAQIYGHILLEPAESPLETVALFHGALTLWAFCQVQEPSSKSMLCMDNLKKSGDVDVQEWFNGNRRAEFTNIGTLCGRNKCDIVLALADTISNRSAWHLSHELSHKLREFISLSTS